MIDFLNWWVETWLRAIVGTWCVFGTFWLIYDCTVLVTNAWKAHALAKYNGKLLDAHKDETTQIEPTETRGETFST